MLARNATLALLVWTAVAAPQPHTDRTTYNAGSTVRLKGAPPQAKATVRYAGDSEPVLREALVPGGPGYVSLWKVPEDARTGRYEVLLSGSEVVATFAVHRKRAQIEAVDFDRTIFTSGDPVPVRVSVRNVSARPLDAVRIEFSEYYFPWIAPGKYSPEVHPVVLAEALTLPPGAAKVIENPRAAVAAPVDQPSIASYAVVVWDRERRDVLDLFFTRPVFIRPPGIDLPKPYPFLYLYPDLKYIAGAIKSYRHFYPPRIDFGAIEFDREHTMFPVGGGATRIRVRVNRPAGTTPSARLTAPGGAAAAVPLDSAGAVSEYTAGVRLPQAGIYSLEVTLRDQAGATVASNSLELAANELPASILVFGAHEDDDMAHPATIRAAVENHIPIQFVYFTSGDAGGCDRYFARSCGPEEAMDFGQVRMQETRAALGHLGIERSSISFLGLPDGGMEQIWYRHRAADRPYLSVLLASHHAPYRDAAIPNLPYARVPVVEAAKQYIRRFKPAMIITGHPDEGHVDHRASNWFVVKALQELVHAGEIPPEVTVRVDQVYGAGPQSHAPYRYRKHVLHVPAEAAARAQEAWWYYQSQDGNHFQGVIKPYAALSREEVHWDVLDWLDHQGWNDRQ